MFTTARTLRIVGCKVLPAIYDKQRPAFSSKADQTKTSTSLKDNVPSAAESLVNVCLPRMWEVNLKMQPKISSPFLFSQSSVILASPIAGVHRGSIETASASLELEHTKTSTPQGRR